MGTAAEVATVSEVLKGLKDMMQLGIQAVVMEVAVDVVAMLVQDRAVAMEEGVGRCKSR